MPSTDSPAIIVARFLKAHQYQETLDALIKEAGLPSDAGALEQGGLTLDKILEEKKVYDLSLMFERLGASGNEQGWSTPAPSCPVIVKSLPSSSNLLHVSIELWGDGNSEKTYPVLLATTADRRMNILRLDQDFSLVSSNNSLQDSPTLSCVLIGFGAPSTISAGMSGQLVLYDHETATILEERRDHKKYVVQVTLCKARELLVATCGWDQNVFIYTLAPEFNGASRKPMLGAPMAFLTLPTNPETITFVKDPGSAKDLLMVTRRDSTFLYYYGFPDFNDAGLGPQEMLLLGRQNLAPCSNAWIAFTASSVAVSPKDPTLLAVATSSIPHMKLIIVRLLVPNSSPSRIKRPESATPAAQARANLAVQDKEDAAIIINTSTMAPQTPYSTPQVCWRPDGSGVWVNGDDGVLRGIEAKTGKIVATLKDGHEAGSKIRCIWAGMVEAEGREEEWVVSGGFDRRLVVWKPDR